MPTVVYKNLNYFFLAAFSLLVTGVLLNPIFRIWELIFLVWTTITGIFIVYRVNDAIDHTADFRLDIRSFCKNKLNIFFIIQSILLILPVTLLNLSPFRFVLLAIMFFMGILYSINVVVGPVHFRIKKMFLVKNIFIGLCWGGLILIGSNQLNDYWSFVYFSFSSIQVFIGSIIRDMGDIEQDRKDGVRSFPVTFGKPKTITFLSLINTGLLIYLCMLIRSERWILPLLTTSLWRYVILYKTYILPDIQFWSQRMNLLTCSTILLGTFIVWIY